MTTAYAPTQPAIKENPAKDVNAPAKSAQLHVTRRSPAYWRVTIDNPPINVMGPEMVKQFQEVINALETDEQVRVVVFDSAVDDYFLNHSDFMAKLEDLTSMPAGPTGLPPWPDFLVRLTRLPVASIALIRGRATGNGSEITLACDMSFASREKAIISQWEVGVGMVAGGGPMARLPRLIGRNRALEVLLSSEDIRAEQAEAYGYINRALPDADLDVFVEALATRIAKFDKWAIAQTKRLVNTSLPPDVELGAGWDACIASLGRPAAQEGIKALMARGFHKPGGRRESSRILLGPNRALGRPDAVPNSGRKDETHWLAGRRGWHYFADASGVLQESSAPSDENAIWDALRPASLVSLRAMLS
jgi:enoyl-CoA hydratase/carnithine racemase